MDKDVGTDNLELHEEVSEYDLMLFPTQDLVKYETKIVVCEAVDFRLQYHFNERLKEILMGKVTSDTSVKIYDEWGQNGYDQSVLAQAYIGPEVTAKTIASLYDKSERDKIESLDIGAGTGLVGEQLRKFGFSKIDALEPASGMLGSARNKNLYRNYYNHYLKKDTLIEANGGNIVLTMKKQYDVPGYSESMRSLIKHFENSGKWEKKLESQFPNYFEDAIGVTYVFKLL
ncbi:unnamed protein product [Mytilus coruscus]|uniref:Uncharacterized protein n=1 Tax=Mytilus coruscus TaxID=42192 RepID=A0A6J8DLN2_MYTCO|nr:unnamed protein product [Mytilus coruscus]